MHGRRVEEELRLDARLGLDPLGRPACGVGRCEGVVLAEVEREVDRAREVARRAVDRQVRHELPASSLSCVVAPPQRSGASATKPSAASRSVTSLMWLVRSHYSWMAITPCPDPDSGTAR
jgi:hypothetical protein